MDNGINALSLFDGMSCFQIALDSLNINVANYYASEIDKHAIKVTMANYPNTIQLGSVLDLDTSTLPPIKILCGGSPCQSFSFAGKRKGMSTKCSEEVYTLERYLELKADGYAFEGQSYLFWEYMRVLTELRKVNPGILFLLENVEMGEKWERVLSKAIGVNGIHINSALLSAQSRKRIYWSNIGLKPSGLFGDLESIIPQPKDKGILLKDILEKEVDEKYFLSKKLIKGFIRHTDAMKEKGNGFAWNPTDGNKKGNTLTARMHKMGVDDNYVIEKPESDLIACGRITGRNPDNPKSRVSGLPTEQMLELREDAKSGCLTTVQKDNVIVGQLRIPEATKKGYVEVNPGECFDFENPKSETRRGRKMEDKSNCLMAKETDFMQYTYERRIRRLTPTECEALQTIPIGYTAHTSDTQRYRMLGNGFTKDVIAYILSFADLPKKTA